MNIQAIPALSDNYIWLIEAGDKQAIVVDPGVSKPVLNVLEKEGLELYAILLTHEHEDHIGGVKELKAQYPDALIFGPIEVKTIVEHVVEEGNGFELLNHDFGVIKTAGHTSEHISFIMDNEFLFCGDALFSGGCGRVFTGDYKAQFDALKKFNQLPDSIKIYAGHEYTQTNLRFALTIEPDNSTIQQQLELVEELRAKNQPTLPTILELEKEINVFLKAKSVERFKHLRDKRDKF